MRHNHSAVRLTTVPRLTIAFLCMLPLLVGQSAFADCSSGTLLPGGDDKTDLKVDRACTVVGADSGVGVYVFHYVNIVAGGSLEFEDKRIDFHAESIIVENGGKLIAGSVTHPIGDNPSEGETGPRLRIYLWGPKDDPGAPCVSDERCGIPEALWTSNQSLAMHKVPVESNRKANKCVTASSVNPAYRLPGDDCFYQYDVFDAKDAANKVKAYFGHKVLALSYGGTILLYGKKGATYSTQADENPANTGSSWVRLTNVSPDKDMIAVSNPVNWSNGDHIVITTTDYLPSHTEERVVDHVNKENQVFLTTALTWQHNAETYSLGQHNVPADMGPRQDPNLDIGRAVDTRAAVGLLTRSIAILSEGEKPDTDTSEHDHFPVSAGFFGGHTLVRQGFTNYQVKGVEFYQLGQGGAIGHYPVHFHMARKTPQLEDVGGDPTKVPYFKDSSIHESMTRWITVHATQGMTIARNVGYLSIGHGFYLEDATEINNKLYANLGVSVMPAVKSATLNPREVPGILARPGDGPGGDLMPYRSDWNHPTTFWIMNGWNDFEYNMAAGVTACGACYWLLPGANSGPSMFEVWDGYASQQLDALEGSQHRMNNIGRAGLSPLKKFLGNSCVAAMNSFQTVGDTNDCLGFSDGGPASNLHAVKNDSAPPKPSDPNKASPAYLVYYPQVTGLRDASECTGADTKSGIDCSSGGDPTVANKCAATGEDKSKCMVTVLDHYTTSFNWAQTNFAAVWLRPWWFLVTDSAITDSQYAGLNFVTGGGYTRSDAPAGYWSLAYRSVFIGSSQKVIDKETAMPANPYASNAGPFNPDTKNQVQCDNPEVDRCLSRSAGISIMGNPFPGQRMFSVYDGPAFQQNNAFLDIYPTMLTGCTPATGNGGLCEASGWMYGRTSGIPKDGAQKCYLPNAAIAWKQPNGFYYPPAFHSENLFFNNANIRHFLIEPSFETGTFKTKLSDVQKRYCTFNSAIFDNFTDIDRQTVLNDGVPSPAGGDGSLTGLTAKETIPKPVSKRETISVNEDAFFNAPVEKVECASDKHPTALDGKEAPGTAKVSPYEYLTTAIIADCGIGGVRPKENECVQESDNLVYWSHDCGGPFCFGVPLYREYLTDAENSMAKKPKPFISMMGQGNGQRSTLTLNHGLYYIDTTHNCDSQGGCVTQNFTPVHSVSVFLGGHTYFVYFVYARHSTKQTYKIYLGKGWDGQWKVEPKRAVLNDSNFIFNTPKDATPWLLEPTYKDGILTVTIDLTKSEIGKEFKDEFDQFCQPKTYCEAKTNTGTNTKSCVCKPGTDCKDPAVCSWGPKDPDCPETGCYAFAFTMPKNWVAPETPVPAPDPGLFSDDEDGYFNDGNVDFVPSAKGRAQCNYQTALQQ